MVNFPLDENNALSVSGLVVNRVIDLLNEDIYFIDAPDDDVVFESDAFSTASFTKAILYGESVIQNGKLECTLAWRITDQDDFLTSVSSSVHFYPGVSVDLGPNREVGGLQAKVQCSVDDGDPNTGVLTDLKVLLRRE